MRTIFYFLLASLFGCGEFIVDDKEIKDNNRTQDITSDNAEELIWNAFHGGGIAFKQSELQNGLDASFFGALEGDHNCVGGGKVTYKYSTDAGEIHKQGDTLSLDYAQCVRADGATVNGQVTGTYSDVEGYNDAFTGLTMDECAARVKDKESTTRLIIDEAETVIFDREGATMFVRYRSVPEHVNGTPVDQDVYELDESDRVVVINRSPTDYDSTLSADGAQIFLVDAFAVQPIDCQYVKRTIELVVQDLQVQGLNITSLLSSSMTLKHFFRSANNQDIVIEAPAATVSLSKNQYAVDLELRALDFRMDYDNFAANSAALQYRGEMNVSGESDIIDYLTLTSLPGPYDSDIPLSGQFRVLGRGLEAATLNVDSETFVRFSVSTEGDTDGDQRPNVAPAFANSWTDFLDRNFIRPLL